MANPTTSVKEKELPLEAILHPLHPHAEEELPPEAVPHPPRPHAEEVMLL
jgi:hypothetical protein